MNKKITQLIHLVLLLLLFQLLMHTPAMAGPFRIGTTKDINVYFATTRYNKSKSKSHPIYSNERNLDLVEGSTEYGSARVHTPRSLSSMQQSTSWVSFKARLNSNDTAWSTARVTDNKAFESSKFWNQISSNQGIICVFVHGYDESMIDSTRDTALIGYELKQKVSSNVLPILFSWPSLDKTSEYTSDEENMNWSKKPFRNFIENLTSMKSPNAKLYIIGHSLGSRLVFDLTNSPKLLSRPMIDRIVLSSSDFDYHQALQQKQDLEQLVKENISILVSDRDGPLITSQLLHKSPRLGRPIDPPGLATKMNQPKNVSKKSFWKGFLNEATSFLNPKTVSNSQETLVWLSSGKSKDIEFGSKSKFYDVTELVTADLGHRLAWPVITSLLSNNGNLSPLGTTVVFKKPDRLLLNQSNGIPKFLYRFHRITKDMFKPVN